LLAVTVDIEDWYHIPSVTGSPFSRFKDVDEFFKNWHQRYDYLTEPTKRVLDLLDSHNVKATFFVVADITEHYPGLVQQIASRGHEIACHGLHHACKIHPKTKEPLMLPAEFEERALRAKKMLEGVSGQEVIGYRAPAAYVAGWMLDSLERLDFKYDSSVCVNSFYNKSDSLLKDVDTRPYYPKRGSLEPGGKTGILELPWPYFKFGLRFPTGGGPMLRFLGARYIMLGLKQSLNRGDTLFYCHPIDIARHEFPQVRSSRRPCYWLFKGKKVEERIKHIFANIRVDTCTCGELFKKYEQGH